MKRFYGIAFIFLLASCNALPKFMQPQTQETTDTEFTPSEYGSGDALCKSTLPTEEDIQYALNFGSEVFADGNWSQVYEISEYSAYVEYTHKSLPALAYVEMLLFCVDQGTEDVKEWYFDPNIETIFAPLGELTINSCSKDNLLLYEVDADGEDADHINKMWVQVFDKIHVLTVKLVMSDTLADELEEYSHTLFPKFSACP
jgi:hypothetical protein